MPDAPQIIEPEHILYKDRTLRDEIVLQLMKETDTTNHNLDVMANNKLDEFVNYYDFADKILEGRQPNEN